jgi:hypothetical protein
MKGIKSIVLTFGLLFVILCSGSAFADDQQGCLKLKELQPEYNALAKGTTMVLQIKFKTHDCHLPLDVLSSMSIASEPVSGFSVIMGHPGYDKIKKAEGQPGVQTADQMTLPVFVRMPGDVAPGNYEIAAVLKYDAVDDKGDRTQQSTSMVIPVKVVATEADVHVIEKHDSWKPLKETGKVAGMIAVGIVALPVMLVVEGVGFLVTGHSVLPDC